MPQDQSNSILGICGRIFDDYYRIKNQIIPFVFSSDIKYGFAIPFFFPKEKNVFNKQ